MKRRVVLLLSTFPRLSESFIVNKFLGLVDAGWDVHVVSAYNDRKAWSMLPNLHRTKEIHQRVHYNWCFRPAWLSGLLYPFALLYCLFKNPGGTIRYLFRSSKRLGWKALKRFYMDFPIIALNPDLIHYEFGATAVSRSDLGYFLGCKQIASFRGYDLNFSGIDQSDYYDSVWKDIDGFHFLGNALRRRALQRGCPEDKRFTLIPPAIDTQVFSSTKVAYSISNTKQDRPLNIISVGRLEWIKGFDFGIQAVQLLINQGVPCEYRIIGDGSYLSALAFTRHQLGLDDKVTFLGGLPHKEVLEQLTWADVFLHPAISEGFGNAVLEAQAVAIPVICSDAGGLPENIQNNVTGFVVPRRDPTALAEKLALLAASPELRLKMGSSGQTRVKEQFQIKDQINKFINFYEQVISSQ